MATRSRIAIRTGENEVSSIYCHWDGYPEGVGNELITRFNSRELAEQLIELGNRSYLIQPEGHTPASGELYDEPADKCSLGQWEATSKYPESWEQFIYEWIDGEGWIVYDVDNDEYSTVKDAIAAAKAQRV